MRQKGEHRTPSCVCCVDVSSEANDLLVDLAVEWAGLLHATLTLLTVVQPSRSDSRRAAQAQLEVLEARALQAGVAVRSCAKEGKVIETILNVASRADLVVLGPHHHHGIWSALDNHGFRSVGRTVATVLEGASAAVLVSCGLAKRPKGSATSGTWLIGTKVDPPSFALCEMAKQMAPGGTRFVLGHAVYPGVLGAKMNGGHEPLGERIHAMEVQEAVDRLNATLLRRPLPGRLGGSLVGHFARGVRQGGPGPGVDREARARRRAGPRRS